jgi:transposase
MDNVSALKDCNEIVTDKAKGAGEKTKKTSLAISKHKSNGHIYLRTQESYRDKNGNPRHRNCKIVGKVDPKTGTNIYYPEFLAQVQGTDNEPPDMSIQNIYSRLDIKTSTVCEYGTRYILSHIANSIGLEDILNKVFPDRFREILELSMFLTISGDPAMYCRFWQDNITNFETKQLSSQRISELLLSITEDERINFYSHWMEFINENECFALDCSSFSSYSDLIADVSWGYNRDGENLPQVNLCMLVGEQTGTPVFPLLYDGSITDVSILKSMISIALKLILKKLSIIMDKGFFSKKNIDIMFESEDRIRFLAAVPFTTQIAKEQIEFVRDIIDLSEREIYIGSSSIKGITRSVMWNSQHKIYAHIFHNQVATITAITNLDRELAKTRNKIISGETILENNHPFFKLLSVKYSASKKNKPIVKYNYPAINQRVSHAGWMVAISNFIKNPQKAIEIYRGKDVIEKCFYMFKNLLDLNRIRSHSDIAMQSKIFIFFISLIFMSHIHKVMRDNDLYSRLTMKELFKTTDKHFIQHIKNDKIVFTASSEQKKIYSVFNLKVPE